MPGTGVQRYRGPVTEILVKALAMVALGLLLSTVGQDFVSGEERFTFGIATLTDGLGVAIMAIGLFGVSEILMLAGQRDDQRSVIASPRTPRELLPLSLIHI